MKLTAHTLPSRKYEQIVMQREASKKIHHCEGQKGEERAFPMGCTIYGLDLT